MTTDQHEATSPGDAEQRPDRRPEPGAADLPAGMSAALPTDLPADPPADLPADPPSALPTTMRAVVQDVYGEPGEVLHLAEVERPSPRPGEVLVRVEAAGVDRGVWHTVAGVPYPIRLAGYGVRTPRHRVPGTDLTGRVVAAGAGVTRFGVGDDVVGVGVGAFADFSRAREDRLTLRPAGLDAERAAVVPVSGVTALQALRDRGRVRAGQSVLVIGASGGVGTFAVQLARTFGAEVTGVCSTAKVDLVRSIGAHHVVDHTVEEVTDAGRRYDLVLDIGGARSLPLLRRVLAPRGTLVIVGAETGGRWLGGLDRQLRATALSPFVGQRLGTFVASTSAADLDVLLGLVTSGQVTPVLDRTFPLADAPAALEHLLAGRVRGKVAVRI